MMLPIDPQLAKELAEERQSELLEEAEAAKLAKGEIPGEEFPSDDYKPVTDSKDDLIPPHHNHKHIHTDK